MMLQAGLFDDSPRTREIIYNFMRLRALRVEVDVKLALGTFSLKQGAIIWLSMFPWTENRRSGGRAVCYHSGQAISYQIGKNESCGSSPRQKYCRVTSSACGPSMTSYGRMATYRLHCNAGNIWIKMTISGAG